MPSNGVRLTDIDAGKSRKTRRISSGDLLTSIPLKTMLYINFVQGHNIKKLKLVHVQYVCSALALSQAYKKEKFIITGGGSSFV